VHFVLRGIGNKSSIRAHGWCLREERRVAVRAQALVLAAARVPVACARGRAALRHGRTVTGGSSSPVQGSSTPRLCVLLLPGLDD